MELAIDTATRYASVGLSRRGEAVADYTWRSERNHSVELVPAIRSLMGSCGARMEDLTAIFVGVGPGGFSALRVGLSTAKAMALARGLPLVGVGTLDVEVLPYLHLGLTVCALLEAGREGYYVGWYDGEVGSSAAEQPSQCQVLTLDEVAATVRGPTLFCGEGVGSAAGTLRDALGPKALVAGAGPPTRRAAHLAALGHRRLSQAQPADADALQPVYMRGSQFDLVRRRWNAAPE